MLLNVEGLSKQFEGLLQHAKAVLAVLVALLALLLFLTSLFTQATTLSDSFVDVAIYTIYLLFVLLLGSAVFVLYYLLDKETASLNESTELLDAERSQVVTAYRGINRQESEKSAFLKLFQETERALRFDPDRTTEGFALAETYLPGEMAAYLEKQHPQIAAVILLMIDPEKSAAVFEYFEASEREMIRSRIVNMGAVSGAALILLDQALKKELAPLDKASAALRRLDAAEIRAILRQVDKKELMYALKDATQELQESFFANMSLKAAMEFKKKMPHAPMLDKSRHQTAVRRVCLLAERLRDNAKIRVNNTGLR